jgi:hypothetical protein
VPISAGPREVVTRKLVCDGCPKLKTERWKDYLDNDETDSGTSATCDAAGRIITAYWHAGDAAPSWCPHAPPNAVLSGPAPRTE